MGLRADRKKMARKINVGDLVTWGLEASACVVLEVHPDGVVVDADADGFPRHFVTWDGGQRGKGPGSGPVRRVDAKWRGTKR